jgi:hypothetical protein
VASFFGLPTRPIVDPDNAAIVTPKLSFKQLMKNFIGGWIPLYHYNKQEQRVWDLNGKAIWQLIAILVKIFIILPLKILGVFVKTSINILKLFTEFLPMILFPFVKKLIGIINAIIIFIPSMIGAALIGAGTVIGSRPIKILLYGLGALFLLPVVALNLVSMAINYALRIITIVGRAITSPEKSARMALAYGRELKGEIFGVKVGNIVGVLGAAISMAISIVAWTIAFPLAIGAIVSVFPVVLQAVAWVANLPVVGAFISSAYGSLQGAGMAVGAALQPVLGTLFGPVIGLISTALGLHLSAAAFAVGTTLGLLLAPVSAIVSRVADELSNWWASRHDGWPFTWFFSRPKGHSASPTGHMLLVDDSEDTPFVDYTQGKPSDHLLRLTDGREAGYTDALKDVRVVEGANAAVSDPLPLSRSAVEDRRGQAAAKTAELVESFDLK